MILLKNFLIQLLEIIAFIFKILYNTMDKWEDLRWKNFLSVVKFNVKKGR